MTARLNDLLCKYSDETSKLQKQHNILARRLINQHGRQTRWFQNARANSPLELRNNAIRCNRQTNEILSQHRCHNNQLLEQCTGHIDQLLQQLSRRTDEVKQLIELHGKMLSKLLRGLCLKAETLRHQYNHKADPLDKGCLDEYNRETKLLLQRHSRQINKILTNHSSQVNQLIGDNDSQPEISLVKRPATAPVHLDAPVMEQESSLYSFFPQLNLGKRKRQHRGQVISVDELVNENLSRRDILFSENHGRVESHKPRYLWFSFKTSDDEETFSAAELFDASFGDENVFGFRYEDEGADGAQCLSTDFRLPPQQASIFDESVETFSYRPSDGERTKMLPTKICIENLSDICNLEDDCHRRHTSSTYVWDQKDSNGCWTECSADVADQLEEAFCYPNLNEALTVFTPKSMKFDFKNMTYTTEDQGIRMKFRRIATESSCSDATHGFTTKFSWFYVNNLGEYEPFGSLGDENSDPNYLEKEFLKNEEEIVYMIGSRIFSLDTKEMIQTNIETGAIRAVIRRPIELEPLTLSKIKAIAVRTEPFDKICVDNLDGLCNGNCNSRHTSDIFVWDIQAPDGEWFECQENINVQLEQAYSAPNFQQSLTITSQNSILFDFISMTCTFGKLASCPIRRISTESSCSSANHHFTSEYRWFFENEKNFYEEFGTRNKTLNCVNSDYLERKYLTAVTGVCTSNSTSVQSTIDYTIGRWSYELDFVTMQQKNTSTGVIRSVVRRPTYQVEEAPVFICLRDCWRPGSCDQGESCPNLHKDLPYCWQYRDVDSPDSWQDYKRDHHEAIEKQYCNVTVEEHEVRINGIQLALNFDDLLARSKISNQVLYEFRRIATTTEGNIFDNQLLPFTNSYRWYWLKDDQEWTLFTTSESSTDSLSSDTLETALQNDTKVLEFKTVSGEQFRLQRFSTNGALQVNLQTSFSRPVRRRPVFVSAADIERSRVMFPSEWDMQSMEEYASSAGFLTIEVLKEGEDSEEFEAVAATVEDDALRARIYQVWRMQNIDLWEDYWIMKSGMEKAHSAGRVPELLLFHGTRTRSIDPICGHGFDISKSRSASGRATYGQGIYFSTTASYSLWFAPDAIDQDDSKCLLVVKTLVGEFTVGNSEMCCPPPKVPDEPDGPLFDSTVDNIAHPNIYVTYARAQAYPAYLICIRKDELSENELS